MSSLVPENDKNKKLNYKFSSLTYRIIASLMIGIISTPGILSFESIKEHTAKEEYTAKNESNLSNKIEQESINVDSLTQKIYTSLTTTSNKEDHYIEPNMIIER